MLETILSIILTSLLTLLLLGLLIRRTIRKFLEGDLQNILNDVGDSIGTQLNEVIAQPGVSKAMSVLGKKSGEVRATNALRNRVADNLMQKYPAMNMVLQQLDITPIEGLQLLNDPMIGGPLRGILASASKGLGGILGGDGSSQPQGNDKVGYG